jgi:probable rRNA maturation factor
VTSQPVRQIDVSIDEPFQKGVTEEWVVMAAEYALQAALPAGEPGQISLLVTDDATIRDLNRKFRGVDEVTDVLSFSTTYPGHWEGEAEAPDDQYLKPGDPFSLPFVLPPDEAPPLGEVIISYPQAQRQAQGQNESVERELALLIVHGVLHLVGHDHLNPEDAPLMQAKEQAALEALFQAETYRP